MSDQLKQQLKAWVKDHNFPRPDNKKKKPRKQKESLSHRDLEELMGTRRPTYRRKRGGAFKQK